MADLTHIDSDGNAQMVDVGQKTDSQRRALAEGYLIGSADTLDQIMADALPKKEAITTARLAGIMGAKKTADLIPLCHPLGLDQVTVTIERSTDTSLKVLAEATITAKTGVEMEALTAVSVSLLTLYDMAKAIDKCLTLTNIRLLEKDGGKSGSWRADKGD